MPRSVQKRMLAWHMNPMSYRLIPSRYWIRRSNVTSSFMLRVDVIVYCEITKNVLSLQLTICFPVTFQLARLRNANGVCMQLFQFRYYGNILSFLGLMLSILSSFVSNTSEKLPTHSNWQRNLKSFRRTFLSIFRITKTMEIQNSSPGWWRVQE